VAAVARSTYVTGRLVIGCSPPITNRATGSSERLPYAPGGRARLGETSVADGDAAVGVALGGAGARPRPISGCKPELLGCCRHGAGAARSGQERPGAPRSAQERPGGPCAELPLPQRRRMPPASWPARGTAGARPRGRPTRPR
jgi:hypothetical protein